jgi:peptide/nickel transport system ATP-binding protein
MAIAESLTSGGGELPPTARPRTPRAAAVAETATPRDVILDVRNLTTYFYTYDGVVHALEGVSFKIRQGETVGVVGETGCGKSVTAFSITRLIADPPGRIVKGSILFRGANLLWGLDREATFKPIKNSKMVKVKRKFRRIKAANDRMQAVRGRGISMIFQEPMQAMNPVFSIWDQLGEAVYLHRGIELLDSLLAATPSGPDVPLALDAFLEAARGRSVEQARSAAKALALAVNVPSLETELLIAVRQSAGATELDRPKVEKMLKRFRLTALRRSYLRRERRRLELDRELSDTYLEEMRQGKYLRSQRASIRSARIPNQLRRAPMRLWGIRRHVEKPIKEELFWQSVQMLEGVHIANPAQVARGYPHELSGGMLQRVMIAMALSTNPLLLIADEPTTALDVTIQAQILDLMNDLKHRVGTAIVLITHDLAVIAEVADRVCVMYAGQIVENAPVSQLFSSPLHPYTQGLIASIPRFDRPEKQLYSIPGSVPNLIYPPEGCRFHPRCPHAMPVCREVRPPVTDEGNGHQVACHLYHGPSVSE